MVWFTVSRNPDKLDKSERQGVHQGYTSSGLVPPGFDSHMGVDTFDK